LTANELFTLEGPLCALEQGGSRQTVMCPDCGRGRRTQVADLQVSLVCRQRRVWLSDGNAIILDRAVLESLSHLTSEDTVFRSVKGVWRSDLPWAGEPVPDLVQLVARGVVSASKQSVEFDGCACGAVRSISFEPLIVVAPDSASGVWCLAESPEVLVLHASVRDALLDADADLEFLRVWREDEYSPPKPCSGPIDWSDL